MKPLTVQIMEYIDEYPRPTIEELHQVFSNHSNLAVSLAVAELYRENKITSITSYIIMPNASEEE